MDNRSDGLWQGGPWEQPARRGNPAPEIPSSQAAPTPPQRSDRLSHRAGFDRLPHRPCSLVQWRPRPRSADPVPSGSDPGYSSWEQEEDLSAPPSIPQAETGTGVILSITPPSGEALTYTQVYEKAAPSIAALTAYSAGMVSTGTGIVLTADGYIVTNAHIIAGAEQVNVTLSDDSLWSAQLVGFEPLEDLAVLKIDASGLTPAQFGDDTLLRSGDPVSAIGNPMGYRSTITPGIVSALDQPVSVEGTTMYLLQTSAAINYGSSGGALLNDRGQVVGVTTIKIVADDGSAEGLGFAIPTTRVKQVVDRLIAGAPVTRPSLGIIVRRGQGENGGLVVEEVDPDSDCHRQGIQPQDIIVAANGQQVQTFADLERIKRTLDVGDSLLLEVLRGGEHLEFTVTLMDQDDF